MPIRLPSLNDAAKWASAVLVLGSGWAAGRGLAVGLDTAHAATAGFALSGSIFLAIILWRDPEPQRQIG